MNVDVLIVGAGPVGLMLACELQRRGVNYRIVEARPERTYFCKALGVSPRTMEVFDTMGLLDEAISRGLWFSGVSTVANGELVAYAPAQDEKWPYGSISIPQYASEELLEGYLNEHGGRVEYGITVTTLSADGRAELSPGGTVEARYVVGCDGSHSTVRKSQGIGFEGGRYAQVFLLGDVELEGWNRPHSEVCKMVYTEDGAMRNMVVVVPVPDHPHRYRVSMAAPQIYWEDGAQLPDHPPLEMLQETAGPALPAGVKLGNLRWSSMYRISHRLATQYRQGPYFLAGDAAHIHPPIGGLGMNTGLQDAFNLGWKLARVLKSGAPLSLLDTYQEERHRVGQEVVDLTARRMDAAVAGEETNSEKETSENDANSQFLVNYRGLSLAGGAGEDPGPQPGDRMAYLEGLRRPNLQRHGRFVDLLRSGRFVLLDYGGADLGPLARQALGDWVRCYRMGDNLLDDGQVAEAFGPGPGAVLVRPDGYIGWRGRAGDDLARYLRLV